MRLTRYLMCAGWRGRRLRGSGNALPVVDATGEPGYWSDDSPIDPG
jgi:hypothetical protein